MRLQHTFTGHLLVHLAQALTLPGDVVPSLINRDDSGDSKPSGESALQWAQCDLDFGDDDRNQAQTAYDCARLEVPLDYTNKTDGETIKLDLIKAKATKKPVKGSVLYNPGGPGGSGVEAIIRRGERLLHVLGGQYDVIGFDPRGIGRTLPFTCNETHDTATNSLHRREFDTLPKTNNWATLKTVSLKAAGQLADACSKIHPRTGRLIGTAFTARDMASIVDALGQGPKLNYWGTSYGTVLGQVFAAMFPNRIGRMLLDGNLLADDYLINTWISSTRDTERSLAHLFDNCVEAGPELCSLADYAGKNTTGKVLLQAFDALLEELLAIPPPKNGSSEGHAIAAGLKAVILSEIYNPAGYPRTIARVEAALKGNLTAALIPPEPKIDSPWNPAGDNRTMGVACSDSSFRVEDPDDLFSIYQAHLAQSSFADSILTGRLICSQWKLSAVEQVDTNKLRNIKTSFPVLVVNGVYDPVTPLSNAWEVSARLRGSRVLIHEGIGHGINSHPSNCTDQAVAKYFVDGEMPRLNTTCKPDMPAFEFAAEEEKAAKETEKSNSNE
ncbi:hypothetical protein F66182_1489 [Fusarium sp. NRRL 66182]|nr:hypothetical protein F66182_1489 [Fusarium sp. NRRL 66182]